MKNIVIATRNKNKKKELASLLKKTKVKILTLRDLDVKLPAITENGKTFRENAVKKALTVSRYTENLVIADDSGLEVRAISGKPGIRSSRFAGPYATDKENNKKLLRLMKDIPTKKRSATFVCDIAIAKKGKLVGICEGRSKGIIGFESKGRNGFGYDPLFTPIGKKKTFAEMGSSAKNRISHRGRALRKAKSVIEEYL